MSANTNRNNRDLLAALYPGTSGAESATNAKGVEMPTVTVYTTGPGCQSCKLTKMHLNRRGIPYTEVRIDTDDTAAAKINQLGFTGTSAPVVTVGEDQSWNGYRPDKIDGLLQ